MGQSGGSARDNLRRLAENQINFKTRNKVRKATKAGVELRHVPLTTPCKGDLWKFTNESPTRQGKPFMHYAKSFETLKRDHETFLSRSVLLEHFTGER